MTRRAWDPQRLPDLSGRRYLVTGSTRGLGYFSAEQLVRAGAYVIMTGRHPHRLAAAHAAVERRVQDASSAAGVIAAPGAVETLLLDTSNFGSVRAAAATARSSGPLHGLLLNAGLVHPPKVRRMAGGHEMVFATNVLGHFALAGELLQNLAVVGGRMVWIGSLSTMITPYDLDDPELTEDYTPWRAYVQSKLATTALGLEANRRLLRFGVPATSVVAHPGYSISGRTTGVHGVNEPSRMTRFVDNLQTPISHSKERGAQILVRALIDPSIPGGQFWGPRYLVHGGARRTEPAKQLRTPEAGEKLWEYCVKATGVRWPFEKAAKARRRLR